MVELMHRLDAGGGTVASWRWAEVTHLGAAADGVSQVVLQRTELAGSGKGTGFVLSIPLDALRSRFLELGSGTPEVQMFRYVGWDGVPRRMLWCASCGDVVVCDFSDLVRGGLLECRKCGAGITPDACAGHHAYGRCPSCPALADDVESSRSAAATAAAPKAGPGSLGS